MIFIISSCKQQEQKEASGKDQTAINQEKDSKEQPLPKLKFQGGKSRNLGKIREGIKKTVVFTLVNEGETDANNISIHDLSKGGCTAVSRVSNLAAGDTARLKFIFETLGYGGKKESRKIRIRYDNPKESPVTLSVTAEIIATKEHQVPIGELYYNFFVLVDIRDKQAFQKGHIAGAINVPASEVHEWANRLPKDFMIYLYSDSGEKSDIMAKKLREKGFTQALSIIGGIKEWKRRYGGRVIISGSQ
jgi:rhodanese-related sulfurtransferase